jgi:transcriptional regulator with XRE-family HTH domain
VLNSNLLKAAIVRKGLTQGEFAQKIGISHNTLTSRMSGVVPFNVDEVDKACEVLNLTDYEEICNIFLSSVSQNQDKE